MEERSRSKFGVIVLCGWCFVCATTVASASDVLVKVNGESITQDDLDFELLISGLKGQQPETIKQRKLEHLVERELVLQHLTEKGIQPDFKLIDQRIATVKNIITQAGLDPDEILPERGFTPNRLRKFFSSSQMWEQYLKREIDAEQLRKYFESRKSHFDGTEVRVSQIILMLPKPATPQDAEQAKQKLTDIKSQIEQGKLSFADAAKKWSMSESSAAKGGDIDFTFYDGPLPSPLAHKAFSLKVGQLSEPFQSPYGVHLLTVTDIRPGQFQLEDVRRTVQEKLYSELWNKLVPTLKRKAQIEYVK